jgi:hypothetical protein
LTLVDPAERAKHPNLRIAVAGYSDDLNSGSEITMDWGCRAQWLPSGQIAHRCRTFHDSSGSPIVVVDGGFGRRSVIGVNAATSLSDFATTGGQVTDEVYAGAPKIGTGSAEMSATYQVIKRQLGE